MFEQYKNINGNSNIESFMIGEDFISVKFNGSSKVYVYSYTSAGKIHVENMKVLARKGSGLNSYINTNCRMLYVK